MRYLMAEQKFMLTTDDETTTSSAMNVVSIASGVKKAIEWSIHMTRAVPMMSIM